MSVTIGEILLDAHVHVHAGFSLGAFFDAALRNAAAAQRVPAGAEAPAIGLMLTESQGVDAFARWAESAARDVRDDGGGARQPRDTGGWRFRKTAESNSLWAQRAGTPAAEILLIAGRQLVTGERLEMLALGCREAFAEELPLREARDAVLAAGGVPVVPWGFGKWWFARGRVLAELIAADSPGAWFLGDNAGRPRLSMRPRLFAAAARRGVYVLPGSDPLPLVGQESKVGRCGLVLPGPPDRQHPAAMVLDALRRCTRQPQTFGRYESLARFARDQVAMQLQRREGS